MTDSTETPRRMVAVADDDPTCSLMLDRIFSRSGYAVVTFGSGEELLEAVGTQSLDVVCLDMGLPGMTGLDTPPQCRGRSAPSQGLEVRADVARSHSGRRPAFHF